MFLQKLFNKDKQNIHSVITKNNEFFENFSKKKPLKDYDFVVIDTELTGLDSKKDYIVALGAVRIKKLQIYCSQTFYFLVQPEEKLHTESTLIHRITPEELKKAGSIQQVLPQFIEFIGTDVVIGHYIGLDLGFLNKQAKEVMGGIIHNPSLDTMRLAMALKESLNGHYHDHYSVQSAYNLSHLAAEYDLPKFHQHNALQDALQAAYLFLYLVKKLRRNGRHTLKDYLKAGRNWKIIY